MPTVRLAIDGMHCDGCVKRVTAAVQKAGAVPQSVRIGEARIGVTDPADAANVVAALETMGFDARIEPEHAGPS